VDAIADLAICIVTTSPDFAGRMARGIDAVDNLRVSSIMDGTTDLAAALKDEVPDAVVLDQLTCSPLLEKIVRTISRMSRKPHVIVVTARTNISDRQDLLSSGVDFVFTKLRPIAELGLVLKRLGRPESGFITPEAAPSGR
jgi:DNA-binding response OmpR family regulator